MDVSVQYDEAAGSYHLGFTKDGIFVPVYSIPSTQVDTIVQSGKNAQDNASADQPA